MSDKLLFVSYYFGMSDGRSGFGDVTFAVNTEPRTVESVEKMRATLRNAIQSKLDGEAPDEVIILNWKVL